MTYLTIVDHGQLKFRTGQLASTRISNNTQFKCKCYLNHLLQSGTSSHQITHNLFCVYVSLVPASSDTLLFHQFLPDICSHTLLKSVPNRACRFRARVPSQCHDVTLNTSIPYERIPSNSHNVAIGIDKANVLFTIIFLLSESHGGTSQL